MITLQFFPSKKPKENQASNMRSPVTQSIPTEEIPVNSSEGKTVADSVYTPWISSISTSIILLYELNHWKLTKEMKVSLQAILKILEENPDLHLIVNGHSDEKGSYKIKREISGMRADEVAEYLIKQGINPSRIKAFGKSDSEPLSTGHGEPDEWLNRRVEFIFY